MDEPRTPSIVPPEGLTVRVHCRTAPRGKPTVHDVTVDADGRLTTPHDLDLERIGVALGGHLTCVELADHDLPAAWGLLEHTLRTRPADVGNVGTAPRAAGGPPPRRGGGGGGRAPRLHHPPPHQGGAPHPAQPRNPRPAVF